MRAAKVVLVSNFVQLLWKLKRSVEIVQKIDIKNNTTFYVRMPGYLRLIGCVSDDRSIPFLRIASQIFI